MKKYIILILIMFCFSINVSANDKSSFDKKDICRAAISSVMAIKPNILHLVEIAANTFSIRSQKYEYVCKIEGE
jgi:hypothetical protein